MFQPLTGSSICTSCIMGKYIGITGSATGCGACSAGKYAAAQASSSCSSCAVGTFQSLIGSSSCQGKHFLLCFCCLDLTVAHIATQHARLGNFAEWYLFRRPPERVLRVVMPRHRPLNAVHVLPELIRLHRHRDAPIARRVCPFSKRNRITLCSL